MCTFPEFHCPEDLRYQQNGEMMPSIHAIAPVLIVAINDFAVFNYKWKTDQNHWLHGVKLLSTGKCGQQFLAPDQTANIQNIC
jgi:hypothetical protein